MSAVAQPQSQVLPREQWGAPPVNVTHTNGQWVIAGEKNKVTLNETNLAITVQNGSANWSMVPSGPKDLLIKANEKSAWLSLANGKIQIVPYDTGFKTGVKINWSDDDLTLYLTLCLEGRDEELVCDVAADEHAVNVRQLDWPPALDARAVDYTLLSNGKGNLLPRDWPKEYFPIRRMTAESKVISTRASSPVTCARTTSCSSTTAFVRREFTLT
jgi:hypothetical protein